MTTHEQTVRVFTEWSGIVGLTDGDRYLIVNPFFHSFGYKAGILACLVSGATLVPQLVYDAGRAMALVAAERITVLPGPPTIYQTILDHPDRAACDLSSLRLAVTGAADVPVALIERMRRELRFETVLTAYGLTEAVVATMCRPGDAPEVISGTSGRAAAGFEVRIGPSEEILLRGPNMMLGYLDDPAATDAAFAGGWFKTGDLGYFDADGYLFLAGRIRERVNRGGEKIAPQEVDDVLLQHPAVAEAVTFAVPHPTLGEDVGSAVVLRPGAAATPTDIRRFATGRIAAFKVPRRVLIVPAIPKGPSGKVQRIGLAARLGVATGCAAPQPFDAPRTPLEETLTGLWAELLKAERVGRDGDFFALGGDSLLATHVGIRLCEILHLRLDVSDVFAAPTPAEMAEHIETLIHAGAASRAASVDRMFDRTGAAAASLAQERLWHLHRLLPDLPLFNSLHALRVTSSCDASILERSIGEIVRRHDILRTTFAEVDGRCVQVVAPQSIVPLACDDLRALPRAKRETAVRELIKQELSHSFALERGPLIRTRLVRLSEGTDLLLMLLAGIIEDGWSFGVFMRELAALYEAFAGGRPSPLAPLPIQYGDFADWQRRWRSHPDMVAQLDYWEAQLRGPLWPIKLSESRQRRKIDDFCTARQPIALPGELSKAAKEFSQREGVTLFMTLVAALKMLLHRYTGEDDLRIATDVANRNRPQTEGLIGLIANTVVLRTGLHGDPSAREVTRRVRVTILGALANQDVPFEAVVEALERERSIDPAALAPVKLSLQTSSLRPVESASHSLALEEIDPGTLLPLVTVTTFDVTFMLRDTPRGLVGTCEYKPHLFGDGAIDRLLCDFQQVLEQMVLQPERPISLMAISPKERTRVSTVHSD
jgi:non-ribosomal peptide synthetase component F